ncbi:hypothetical protein YB2330_002965 [Saitoella coloradoensis]
MDLPDAMKKPNPSAMEGTAAKPEVKADIPAVSLFHGPSVSLTDPLMKPGVFPSAASAGTAPVSPPPAATAAAEKIASTVSSIAQTAEKIAANPAAAAAAAEQNPAFKAMGLPNTKKWSLPSKPWLAFFAVVGTFTAAKLYDKYHTNKIQEKWIKRVEHLSKEPLGTMELPRKIVVYASAPPGDGRDPARELFKDFVKPILVASAVDYEVVEGRREGEVRYTIAETIRATRRGERREHDESPWMKGIKKDQVGGSLILGRHTYKEYVQGMHEGILGPDTLPPPPAPEPTPEGETPAEEPKKSNTIPVAAIEPEQYATASPAANVEQPKPYALIPLPHILGFLNTHIRTWRYLHKRHLADEVGALTVSAILASHDRPWSPEDAEALQEEERDWVKQYRPKGEGEEVRKGEWTSRVMWDDRVVREWRVYELSPEIKVEEETIKAGTYVAKEKQTEKVE